MELFWKFQINITTDTTSKVQWIKDFTIIIISLYIAYSELSSGFGLAFYRNQPFYLLHGVSFQLGKIFEKILVVFVLFLILFVRSFKTFCN